MFNFEYNEEDARRALFAEGYEEGFAESYEQEALRIAKNLLSAKFSLKDIVKITGVSEEKVLSLANEN